MNLDRSHKQTLLYTSIGLIAGYISTLYAVDHLLTTIKPQFIKVNGKVDRSLQFSYSLFISFLVFMIMIFIVYQIIA